MDSQIQLFKSGVHNLVNNEIIPSDAAFDSAGFVTQDGKIKLVGGRKLVGQDGAVGKIRDLFYGYRNDGTQVLFRKTETAIQWLNGVTWTDTITGLTSGAEYTHAAYVSLAGYFTIFAGVDGLFKINNANPGSYINLYDAAKNDKGKILINKGRLFMWDCANASKTTLKLSWIDAQDGTVYTTVTGEILGASGSITYTGTLAFKAGNPTRNAFALVITGTTVAGVETFTDNRSGVLIGDKGGTGTINYTTGDYVLNFNGTGVTSGNVVASYQWENSNAKGISDFTFSPTRVPGEGNRITQDIGGDPIVSVMVGQDGAYYSIKKINAYKLVLSTDDKTFDNNVYYQNLGMPFFRAGISTQRGIVFMNTANPEKPEMTILVKNQIGDALIPTILFSHFKFSNYDFSDCAMETYERYITVACKKVGSINNDTVLMCNISDGSVDPVPYAARMFAHDSFDNLMIGSPVVQNVYQIFNGFDDDSNTIQAYWTGKAEGYSGLSRSARWRAIGQTLKKFRRERVRGLIDPGQTVEIWISYDDTDFQKVGEVSGTASYVDATNPQSIGSNYIGQAQIGGADVITAYPYFAELKVHPPKFRKRSIKLIPVGLGYFDVEFLADWDIELFENRLPKRFRVKLPSTITSPTLAQGQLVGFLTTINY